MLLLSVDAGYSQAAWQIKRWAVRENTIWLNVYGGPLSCLVCREAKKLVPAKGTGNAPDGGAD